MARPRWLGEATFPALAAFANGPTVGTDGETAQTARALAAVGIAGLLGMPLLMVVSLLLQAPFAVPAAISMGYLAAAHALSIGKPDRAALWSFGVLSALVGWTLLSFSLIEGAITPVWLATSLLAPLFAAAPALARKLGHPKEDAQRRAARDDTACLQRIAPSEAVLILDRAGTLLAGTEAGLRDFGLRGGDVGRDVTRRLHLLDGSALLGALHRSSAAAGAQDMLLRTASQGVGERLVSASLVAGREGTISMRIAIPRQAAGPPPGIAEVGRGSPVETVPAAGGGEAGLPGSVCDLCAAVSFAARHIESLEASGRLRLDCTGETSVLAACDRRLGRRLVQGALEHVAALSGPTAEIQVVVRRLKGAVLLRIACGDATLSTRSDDEPYFAATRALVDQAGGSLVAERRGRRLAISIRLAPADAVLKILRRGLGSGKG